MDVQCYLSIKNVDRFCSGSDEPRGLQEDLPDVTRVRIRTRSLQKAGSKIDLFSDIDKHKYFYFFTKYLNRIKYKYSSKRLFNKMY